MLTTSTFFLSLQAGGSHSSSEQGYIVSIHFTLFLVYFVLLSVSFDHTWSREMRRVYQLSQGVGKLYYSTFFVIGFKTLFGFPHHSGLVFAALICLLYVPFPGREAGLLYLTVLGNSIIVGYFVFLPGLWHSWFRSTLIKEKIWCEMEPASLAPIMLLNYCVNHLLYKSNIKQSSYKHMPYCIIQ